MKHALLLLLVVGCANSYQSARTVAPGKTQVTVAGSRTEVLDEGDNDSIWLGDIMVRGGVSARADLGVRLTRNPGTGENISLLQIDPKFQLTAPDAKTTVSIGVPIGMLWAEESDGDGGIEFDLGAIIISPSLYVGFEVGPGTEVVVSPKFFYIHPDGGDGDDETEFGGSVGIRFTDESRAWAVHPEIGVLRVSEGDQSETFLMFGLGVSAGN